MKRSAAVFSALFLTFGMLAGFSGRDGYVIVEYIRPGGACASPTGNNGTPVTHGWKLPSGGLSYKVVSAAPNGITGSDWVGAVQAAATAWDTATAATLFNYAGTTAKDQEGVFNGQSTVKYGGQVPAGAIAVAWVRVVSGTVAEADIRLSKSFKWALSGVNESAGNPSDDCIGAAGKMDLLNILTHEFGHVVGAAHPPAEAQFTHRTMFPYASYQELYKRSLANGDIASIP